MITSSRVKEGTLTLGPDPTPHDFSCQPSNIRLTPTTETEDPLETLCGDIATGPGTTSWVLQGTAVSDFDDPEGFVQHCFDHDGEQVPFSWAPNAIGGTWSGELFVQAVEIGGDVNTRLTTDFSFAVVSKPIYTPPAPLTATAPEPTGNEPTGNGNGAGTPPPDDEDEDEPSADEGAAGEGYGSPA